MNEILPPRVRLSWLLITTRLSIISLAGMARTLVAVGRSSDCDMFFTTAAAAPRNTWILVAFGGRGSGRLRLPALGRWRGVLAAPLPDGGGRHGVPPARGGTRRGAAAAGAWAGFTSAAVSPVGSGL